MICRRWAPLFVFLALVSTTSSAGLVGGPFHITNSTVDGGGGRSTGGQFIVTGTIGQPDAGVQSLSGGAFQLTGGFWANGNAVPPDEMLFKDGFEGP